MRKPLTNIARLLPCLLALALAASCSTDPTNDSSASTSAMASVHKDRAGAGNGLYLASVDTYHVTIEGCQSGYLGDYTESSPPPTLYRGDIGCLGRLLEFTSGGKHYSPDPDRDFKTLAKGDAAIFVSDDMLDTMTVVISSQLSSPLASGDAIDFKFSETKASATNKSILGVTANLSGYARPDKKGDYPRFSVATGGIKDIDPATGSAYLVFDLDCQTTMKNEYDPATAECAKIRLKDLSYVLVKDVYGDVPCSDSSAQACDRLFNGSERHVDPTVDLLHSKSTTVKNGGFRTKVDLSEALRSPADMAHNPNMILILKAGRNYQYINVDVAVSASLYLTEVALVGLSEE